MIAIQSGQKRIVWFKGKGINLIPQRSRIPVDWLIIGYNKKLRLRDILEVFQPKIIIFDSSCYPGYAGKATKSDLKPENPYYEVITKGAFFAENTSLLYGSY